MNSCDISEQVRSKKSLHESEETSRVLLNATNEAIVLIDKEGRVLDFNESAGRFFPKLEDGLKGKIMYELLDDAESKLLAELAGNCIQMRIPTKYESDRKIRLFGDTAFTVRMENRIYPVSDEHGNIQRLAIYSSEISRERIGHDSSAAKPTGGEAGGAGNKLFETILNQFPGIIWCVDNDLRFTLSHGQGLSRLGLEPNQVLGTSLYEFFDTADPDNKYITGHRKALEGADSSYVVKFRSKYYSCIFTPLREHEEEDIAGVLGIAIDITEQIKLRNYLLKEKERYRELIENIDEVIFSLDCEGRFNYISPAIRSVLGHHPEEVLGCHFNDFIFQADMPLLHKLYGEVLNGKTRTHEFRLPKTDGNICWTRISAKPVIEDEETVGISGIITDITESKSAQAAYLESEQKYFQLIDNLPVGLFRTTLDPEGEFLMVNRAAAEILGFDSVEELLKSCPADLYWDSSERVELAEKLIAKGEILDEEQHFKKADGSSLWAQITARAVYDGEGNPLYQDGIIMDITQRRAAEEALSISEGRFQSIAEGSEHWIWEIGADLRIRYSNARVEDILGYKPTEVAGKSLLDFMGLEAGVSESFESDYTLLNDKIFSGKRYCFLHKDGRQIITESSGVPIFRRDRSFVGFQGITRDVTEEVEAEEEEERRRQQLIQADKMISLGIIVSGVAHEINNPNQFIIINVPLLKRAWETAVPILDEYYRENGDFPLGGISYSKMKPKIIELHNGIYNGAQRIKNIVMSLKDYAREGPSEVKSMISVNEVLQSALVILANLIKKSAANLIVDLSDDIPRVKGNFQRLEQVVINLIQNSCQAVKDSGKAIEISSSLNRDKENVQIVIRDEGEGIEESRMKYLFDPFYTTRRDDGGTGLGLSISAGIIKDHNGKMEFKSDPGKGTTVTITLPLPHNNFSDESEQEKNNSEQ